MRKIPQMISLLAVSVFTLGVVAVVPVAAESGSGRDGTTVKTEDDSENSSSGSESGQNKRTQLARTNDDSVSSSDDDDGTPDQGRGDAVTTKPSELRERAQKLLAAERQERKGKSLEDRQKSCEARKANILKRSSNYARNAKKHLGVFDSIYTKVLNFQEEKNLTADNYDALKAAADAKKTAATEAVAALEDLNVEVDCSADDPAAAVAELKTAVGNARKALHEYRLAIKNVVVALQNAVDDDDSTTETNDSGTDSAQDQTEAN